MKSRGKELTLALMVFFFVFVSLFGSLANPQPAQAVAVVATIKADVPRKIEKFFSNLQRKIKIAVLNGLVQGLKYAMQKMAYDSAVYLASGGQGQESFFNNLSAGDYMKSVLQDSAMRAIDAFGDTGLNLCRIPDVRVDLAFRIGFLDLKFNPMDPAHRPRCNWNEFRRNWSRDGLNSMYGSDADWLGKINASLDVDQSGLGIMLTASERIDRIVATQQTGAMLTRQEEGEFKAKTTPVSQKKVTPSKVHEDTAKAQSPTAQQKQSMEMAGKTLGTEAWEIIPGTARIFLSTLASQMVKNFKEKGMFPFGIPGFCVGGRSLGGAVCDEGEAGPLADTGGEFSAGPISGRRAAEAVFSEYLVPRLGGIDRYDIIAQLSNCPDNPGVDNCAMDEALAQASREAEFGAPLTLREAMQKGWLHRDWKLLPPSNALNSDSQCFNQAYCYSNIQKLRKARLLPLGFEIAALNSNPDTPWTLGQVVDGFSSTSTCSFARDSGGRIADINYDAVNFPFCHLIDPNWVIKAPPTRCKAVGYGSSVIAGSPERVEGCVDMDSCVGYARDGSCATYGYCSREKNVWKFGAQSCDAQYASCRAFTRDGAQLSYLYRTLDTGYCNQSNVGCRAYSLMKNPSGAWLPPKTPAAGVNYGINPGIFFNARVSTACPASSVGCSRFNVASSSLPVGQSSDQLFLRQAPDYLRCYDATPGSVGSVDWPRTPADLARMNPSAECDDFAKVCIPDEVNCNRHIPVNPWTQATQGGEIPGRFTPRQDTATGTLWNDECPSACAGYASYREMPSAYSNGENLSYLIPSPSAECSAAESGCTGFTNLSAIRGEMEQVEYYSYLRPCVRPDPERNPYKTFYTYEGSTDGGYQLKVFTLLEDRNGGSDPAADGGRSGGPEYFAKTAEELVRFKSECSRAAYRGQMNNLDLADCREFNDGQGNVYYRLLSHTVVVSGNCTPYRLNETELYEVPRSTVTSSASCAQRKGFWDGRGTSDEGDDVCRLCFQNGEYRDGYCLYEGLPSGVSTNAGASRACGAEVNGCRQYKGNAGNNVRDVFRGLQDFESSSTTAALQGWEALGGTLTHSSESTRREGRSLGFTGSGSARIRLSLNPQMAYDLTFWAKGSVGNLTVRLVNDVATALGTVTVGDVWNYYHLGPAELGGSVTSTFLEFDVASEGGLFLDNIRLMEVQSYAYLVKSRLTVPASCDSDPNDNLPGEMLGCSAYRLPSNDLVYLTNFSYLCREEAIGCTALHDTYNTYGMPDEELGRAYNVWLNGNSGTTASATIRGETYQCGVPIGRSGCYVSGYVKVEDLGDIAEARPSGRALVVTSTVFAPPDTPSTTPIYLVAEEEAGCAESNVGCQYAAQQTMTPQGARFETTTLKNDPSGYENTLCQSEAVGCAGYRDQSGDFYFKDPAVLGQKLCQFRTNVASGDTRYHGWFWKGVGVCGASSTLAEVSPRQYCIDNADCASFSLTSAGASVPVECIKRDQQPCYPDYLQAGNVYGLWSYGNTSSYQNFVGECPMEQAGCSEFVDHNDNDARYYLIDNGNLNDGDCDGGVGLKYGCAVFDQTDNPNKRYNTAALYRASEQYEQTNNAPMPATPDRNPAPYDANTILKVVRDRECGEWLQCRSSHRVWDDKLGKFRQVCDDIGRCNRLPAAFDEEQDITNCANWVDGSHEYARQLLTPALYARRSVAWQGMDYSGISLLNQYPPEELKQIQSLASGAMSGWRLMKTIACGGVNCVGNNSQSPACENNNQSCGFRGSGLCVNSNCVISPRGDTANVLAKSPAQACRAYPESNSPFPNTPEMQRSQVFPDVNYCQEAVSATTSRSAASACDCDYTKAEYGDEPTKYWSYDEPNSFQGVLRRSGSNTAVMRGAPAGFCADGRFRGYACDPNRGNADCTYGSGDTAEEGTCAAKTKEEKWIGWRGFCLEEDISRAKEAKAGSHPCLTWLPVEQLNGARDLNNQHREAGYQGSAEGYGKYYCLGARGNMLSLYNPRPESYTKVLRGVGILRMTSGNQESLRIYNRELPDATDYPDTREAINFDDIDSALITIGSVTTNNAGFDHGIVSGRYYIRNGSRENINVSVKTLYGTALMEMGGGGQGVLGCRVVDGQNNLTSEVCLEGEKTLPTNLRDTASAEGFQGPPAALSEVKTSPDGRYKVMKFIFDDQESFMSGASDHDVDEETEFRFPHNAYKYLSNGLGFFPEYGDRLVFNPNRLGADSFIEQTQWGTTYSILSGGQVVIRREGDRNFRYDGDIEYPYGSGAGVPAAYLPGDSTAFPPAVPYRRNESFDLLTRFCSNYVYHEGHSEQDQDMLEMMLVFEKDSNGNYILKRIKSAYCTSGLDGDNKDSEVFASIQLKMRETCEAVADTDPTSIGTVAWTNRLWTMSPWGRNMTLAPLSMAKNFYITQKAPFGSLSLLDSPQYRAGIIPLYSSRLADARYGVSSPARVIGSPYSCGQNTVTRSCGGAPQADGTLDFNRDAIGSGLTWRDGFNVFDNLFARLNKIYFFDPAQNSYTDTGPAVGATNEFNSRLSDNRPDAEYTVDPTPNPPQIRALSHCDQAKDQCREAGAGLTINGRSSGNIVMPNRPARATVKFYGFADENHMPLRRVRVDWGDGRSETDLTGYFRNQRGTAVGTCPAASSPGAERKCQLTFASGEAPEGRPSTWETDISCHVNADCQEIERCVDENNAVDFGSIKDRTCDNAYFRFDHVYECVPTSTSAWKPGYLCESPDLARQYGGCCEFRPKAQIRDNWGFCNGVCSGAPSGDACFENECNNPNAGQTPWQVFNGKLLVAPTVEVGEED